MENKQLIEKLENSINEEQRLLKDGKKYFTVSYSTGNPYNRVKKEFSCLAKNKEEARELCIKEKKIRPFDINYVSTDYAYDESSVKNKNEDKKGIDALNKVLSNNNYMVNYPSGAKFAKTLKKAEEIKKELINGTALDITKRPLKVAEKDIKIKKITESSNTADAGIAPTSSSKQINKEKTILDGLYIRLKKLKEYEKNAKLQQDFIELKDIRNEIKLINKQIQKIKQTNESLKVGDKVKFNPIFASDGISNTGIIIRISKDKPYYVVRLKNGKKDTFDIHDLTLIESSIKSEYDDLAYRIINKIKDVYPDYKQMIKVINNHFDFNNHELERITKNIINNKKDENKLSNLLQTDRILESSNTSDLGVLPTAINKELEKVKKDSQKIADEIGEYPYNFGDGHGKEVGKNPKKSSNKGDKEIKKLNNESLIEKLEKAINEEKSEKAWLLWKNGGSIGEKTNFAVDSFDTQEEAQKAARRMNKLLSPGEKNYYKLKYSVKKNNKVNEEISTDEFINKVNELEDAGNKVELYDFNTNKKVAKEYVANKSILSTTRDLLSSDTIKIFIKFYDNKYSSKSFKNNIKEDKDSEYYNSLKVGDKVKVLFAGSSKHTEEFIIKKVNSKDVFIDEGNGKLVAYHRKNGHSNSMIWRSMILTPSSKKMHEIKGIEALPKKGYKKSFKGCSLAKDKNGYFVYTHRARSKSYEHPDKISNKDINFIDSTG